MDIKRQVFPSRFDTFNPNLPPPPKSANKPLKYKTYENKMFRGWGRYWNNFNMWTNLVCFSKLISSVEDISDTIKNNVDSFIILKIKQNKYYVKAQVLRIWIRKNMRIHSSGSKGKNIKQILQNKTYCSQNPNVIMRLSKTPNSSMVHPSFSTKISKN